MDQVQPTVSEGNGAGTDPQAPNRMLACGVMLCVLLVGLFGFGLWVRSALRDSIFLSNNAGFLDDPADWPVPLQEWLKDTSLPATSVDVYKLDAFIDQASIWRIARPNPVQQLIAKHRLKPVNNQHPKFLELMQLLPASWTKPNANAASIFASDRYGTEFQDGVDLLIVVDDPSTGVTYVKHHCIF